MEAETSRLALRPLCMDDSRALARLQAMPEMMRYFADGHAYGEHESRTWLEWHVAMWEIEGYGFWAVELKESGEFVGWLGVSKVWDPPELMPSSELGWFIDRSLWGLGLATEGARRAVRFAFDEVGLDRVIARYRSENLASLRVMEKVGMHFLREVPHHEVPGAVTRIYEMTASDPGHPAGPPRR